MKNKSANIIEKEFKNLRKELLDLTLRNQLLNFKTRAKTITIVNQSPINIYQTLVLQENKMYFVANKKDKKEDKSSVWDHIPFDFSKFSEGDKKLATDLTPKELQKRLYYINNQAKTMLQEQGYNILYLAVGFLEWRDKSKPRQTNLAPLVLIPVSMERKKVGESFNLEWTGEDIQTNISLKAKLLEAGIELPDFEFKKYGEVIDHYIAKVKRATARMDGWKVNNNVAIGFFSFTKFVMYNDLNPEAWADNVDLAKNELIQAIFNPAKNDQTAFREEDIDTQLEYADMYQVLDADSSQIAAIQDVKAGRNLVVEGPPGTGKSQTIVNLIAELLAEGKSVLFVSEKMAALDVVKDRLTSVGLGKFILELHSHKTRRKKFLKELEKATNVRSKNDLNIDQTIRKLETLRRQLDDYPQIIHKPAFAVNLSPFQLYGMKEAADDHFSRKNQIIPLVRFTNPDTVTLKDLDDLTLALENLAELYQTISKENPWSKCAPKSLLPADLREIEILINDTLLALDSFLVERGRVYDIYGIKKPDTLNEFQNSLSAFEIIKSKNAELIDGDIIKSGAWEGNNDDAFRLIQELERYQKYSPLLDKFNSNIYHADIESLMYQLQDVSNKKFRFFNNKQHIEIVERYYSVPVSGSPDDIIRELNEARAVLKIKKKLDANEHLGKKYFGAYWHLGADVNDLKAIASWMNEFTMLVHEGTFSQNTIDMLSKDLYDIRPERDLAEYIDSGEKFVRVLTRLKDKLNPRSKLIFKRETGDVPFEDWREQLYNWRGQLSSLHLWSQYLNTKNAIQGSDASMFIDSIEKRNIKKDDVEALVQGNFADSLLNILFVENQELATFIGELHENRIREFRDLDKKILELNRKRIFQKLNNNIPQIFGATEHPQAKILAGEFTRKSGHMPVRKLLEKAGGMIKQIKPCFMMSPLSVAQYLDPTNDELQFDVVIFDEASQVKPEDALGAFMRGKTAVVMGDTQQLPPTSFFDQMSSGESDEEEATSLDMESILHLCKLSFPVKMLKWHYRSRHESLISVSNKEFYDNELLVYPSPSHNDPELGLKFHYNPNTAYDRGSSSANPLEAKDVVDEIFNHFDKYGDTKSLGVGTFSVAQKNAILEELEVRRKERPELEPLFSENKDERFFVKNLETIQGDERDVILISVGYGYDRERKMSLNFGPLNQDGGERRLNVLITRAREKCVVFSNFKAYDMHLTANPPYGVKSLKEFLEYAENLTLGTPQHEEHTKEPFEDAIYSFLIENGYQVDKQIGCAGFRVDLAIVDEENPGKYILGITTDGKMYASSKVARDRDRLREQVLNGLGWKLYHLWSTDWYRNRDLGRKKLLDFIEKSIKETRAEEKRKSEEAKKLAEKRRIEAEKKAEELRLARERELAEEKDKDDSEDEIDGESIGPSDFVEVEKVDDVLEKPVDVSAMDPSELFADDESESEFVEVEDEDDKSELNEDDKSESEFVEVEDDDKLELNDDGKSESEFVEGDSDDELKPDIDANDDESTSMSDGDLEIDEKTINVQENEGIDETSIEDKEIWESNDDAESVDSDENVLTADDDAVTEEDSPNEEVEVTIEESDEDSLNEDTEEEPVSFKQRIKSFIKQDSPDDLHSLSPAGFDEESDKDSELEDEVSEETSIEEDEKVDLGSDDDYIYVDHSNDEVESDDEEDPAGDIDDSLNETSEYANPVDEMEDSSKDIAEDIDSADEISEDIPSQNDFTDIDSTDEMAEEEDEPFNVKFGRSIKEKFSKKSDEEDIEEINSDENILEDEEIVDLGSDDDYIYVDHSNDEQVGGESMVEDFNEFERKPHEEPVSNESFVENDAEEDLSSEGNIPKEDDKVDLGPDEDYIYVDHSNDEPVVENEDGEEGYAGESLEVSEESETDTKHRSEFVKSIISDVINADSKLQPEEIETFRGEVIDEDDDPRFKPAPNDDSVVEAEIVNDDGNLNIFTDTFDDDVSLDRPTPKDELNIFNDNFDKEDDSSSRNESIFDVDSYLDDLDDDIGMENKFDEKEEELNIFTDELPDMHNHDYDRELRQEASNIVDNAMDEFISGAFNKNDSENENESEDINDYNQDIQNDETNRQDEDNGYDASISDDGVTYYQGANDVTYKLRKNNVYYDEHESRSLKDSIKGIKNDMKYINKSLKEIENPTQIDYVSVVDRTEEYDPADYLNMPSDDDSDIIIQREEESTFVENESQIFEKEIANDDVIVPITNQHTKEELKDQALEDIIQTANEDYKKIEKQRFRDNNTLKSFDDKKLPGKKKAEDNIIDYVEANDFGLNSSDDLYKQPISNVANSINNIVDIEGPIHVNEVTKRVKDSCHIKRAGSKLKNVVNDAISQAESSGDIIRIGDFLYDASNNNVVIRKRNKPNIELISDEEIAKSIELVLLYNSNVSTSQIARETSRNFGFKSTSKKTAARINSVLDLMIANNRVKIENNYVELA